MGQFRVWRLFRPLAGYTDSECREILRRALTRYEMSSAAGWWWGGLAALGALAGFGMGLEALGLDLGARGAEWLALAAVGVGVVGPVLIGFAACWGCRRVQSYLALRRLLRLATCRRCAYPLEGLRLIDAPGLEVNPAERRVRCPECGRSWSMLELGLSPLDLLPWENRQIGAQVGRIKRVRRER